MKRSTLQNLWLAVLLLASCSQDELTEQGMALPDGAYPLTFTTMQTAPMDAPQTRVAENPDGESSTWSDGDKIKVTINGGGNDRETSCTLDANGNVTAYDPQLYWQNTNDATIHAWYSNITGQATATKTVSLADQSQGLAYVLKAEELTASYQTPSENMKLKFQHQLAKVRVKLEKGTYEGDLSEATVKVKGYTSCTVTEGEVSQGSSEGYIQMLKNDEYYEANLVPGTFQASEAFEISANSKTVKASLNEGDKTLEKEKVYTITITMNAAAPEEIDFTQEPGDYTVTKGANVIIDGKGKALDKRIIIEGGEGTIVKLQNVKLNAPQNIYYYPIEVKGSATLLLSGQNEITGTTSRCPLVVTAGTLIIDGTNDDLLKLIGGKANLGTSGCLGLDNDASLIIKGGHIVADGSKAAGAGIGTYFGGTRRCGTITINGGIIEARGGNNAAGIGGGNDCDCGDIIITGGNITAIGGGDFGGAGIGSGAGSDSDESYCGNITISGENTVVTATAGSNSDDIGVGGYASKCGTVTITDAQVTATNGRIHSH